jgi:hypothetical protein
MILPLSSPVRSGQRNCAGDQAVARLNVVVSPCQSVDRLQPAAAS